MINSDVGVTPGRSFDLNPIRELRVLQRHGALRDGKHCVIESIAALAHRRAGRQLGVDRGSS